MSALALRCRGNLLSDCFGVDAMEDIAVPLIPEETGAFRWLYTAPRGCSLSILCAGSCWQAA